MKTVYYGWIESGVDQEAVLRGAGVEDMPGRKLTFRPDFLSGIWENCAIPGDIFEEVRRKLNFSGHAFSQVTIEGATPRTEAAIDAPMEGPDGLDIVKRLTKTCAEVEIDLGALRDRMLNVARGCHDYGGGYRDAKESEIYHHGIQTVIQALEGFARNSSDTQVLSLERHAAAQKGRA